MRAYKALHQQVFTSGEYKLVPIRHEDRYKIMQWRNEQIYHLRQAEPLTKESQDVYFENVVAKLFDQEKPAQILFSFLKGEECIGYGGLVHINWVDKNAEISFIMRTDLESNEFNLNWSTYLLLIQELAFAELKLHKIFTYAFDLRPKLYAVLDSMKFTLESRLKEHALFNGEYVDVLIHSLWNNHLTLRFANSADIDITYQWANDVNVRRFSFTKGFVEREAHESWFNAKLVSDSCDYLIAEVETKPVGSFRIDYAEEIVVSFLLDPVHQGKGLGLKLLEKGVKHIRKKTKREVVGYVLPQNQASARLFRKLNFKEFTIDDGTLKFILQS
ncbi:MAG: GNAT family N-acetyltransferase [Bacteroidetes bacterium]|nr:MAG: GNAT family N-acetyltransferase [Bacteroidota bacterium]